jgi:hypothetical protein
MSIGDIVQVRFEDEWLEGKISQIYPHYGFHGGELKYEVHGTKKPYITIVSPRLVKHAL